MQHPSSEPRESLTPISIVILTRNRQKDILRAVESALAQDFPTFEVVVVDNGSEPSPIPSLREKFGHDERLRLFDSRTNLGAAGGRNFGVANARYPIIAYIDDDSHFLRTDTLRYITEFFVRYPDAGALQLDIIDPDGALIFPWRGPVSNPSDPTITEVNFLATGGCAVTRRAHELSGGFPEDYVVGYEDNYYALAMIRADLRIYRTSAQYVEHPNPTTQNSRKQPHYYRMLARNLQWLYFELFPLRESLRIVPLHLLSYLKSSIKDRAFSGWRQGFFEGLAGVGRRLRQQPKLSLRQLQYIRSLDQ